MYNPQPDGVLVPIRLLTRPESPAGTFIYMKFLHYGDGHGFRGNTELFRTPSGSPARKLAGRWLC